MGTPPLQGNNDDNTLVSHTLPEAGICHLKSTTINTNYLLSRSIYFSPSRVCTISTLPQHSRRTYDAFIAGCVPLFVGTRLWGRCDPPCRPGWGWRVPGAPYPHLPFHGLWIDWSRFPLLDELALVSAQSNEEAEDVLKRALKPFHDQVVEML